MPRTSSIARFTPNPRLLEWALERSGIQDLLKEKFDVDSWISKEKQPTLKQLENFAKAAYVPFGFLMLNNPPKEELPLKDLRTFAGQGVRNPSPNLIDTIYICQRRQSWYKEYARSVGESVKRFVGSATLSSSVVSIAANIAQQVGYSTQSRVAVETPAKALKQFIDKVETAGILVMISGVVGNNNKRELALDEFRGFALSDQVAPLVFINGNDSKAAQIFTLAHEVAHIWLGQSVLSDMGIAETPRQDVERWCNAVAAELLVPVSDLNGILAKIGDPLEQLDYLAKYFKVSKLVVLRRLLDAGAIIRSDFNKAYENELSLMKNYTRASSGGNFYALLLYRLGARFTRAVVTSTFDGQTLFNDAFKLVGVRNEEVLQTIGMQLEAMSS